MHYKLTTFPSPIGWIGILDSDGTLQRIKIGFTTEAELVKAFAHYEVGPSRCTGNRLRVRKRFEGLLKGVPDDLSDVKIDTNKLTEFQHSVVLACRKIPFGKTVSYGQLATQVGRPKAARAVGSVMRKNRFPIVVPCHRVVSAGGIGGFTAPQGLTTKLTLQAIESGHTI